MSAADVSVLDVADYIRSSLPETDHKRLQRLAYYAQAWSIVWLGVPLFHDDFEAWPDGPISPVLRHREAHGVSGRVTVELTDAQMLVVDAIVNEYGEKSTVWLSSLAQREKPWKEARGGLSIGETSKNRITVDAMREYYSKNEVSDTFHLGPTYFRSLELLVGLSLSDAKAMGETHVDAAAFVHMMEHGPS